jgi:tetratricopeptide (TPR) repeat protein
MDDHAKQLLSLGRDHYEKGEYDRAESALRQVVQRSDRFADVFDMLGVIAHAKGDLAGAEKFFERAVALNPSYTEALLNLAVTYNDLGKYAEARKVYARMRDLGARPGGPQLDPFARGKLANMHADLAQAYVDAGLPAEAIAELEKAVALCPSFADLRTRLGNLHRDGGDLGRARAQYEQACAANPDYLPARIMLGVVLLAQGETAAATDAWREVLAKDPAQKSAAMYLRMAEGHATRLD